MKITNSIFASLLIGSLAACGGGGGGGGAPASNPDTGGGETPPTPTQTLTRVGASGCQTTQLTGAALDQGLSISRVSLLQVVEQQADDSDAVLAGNKDIVVRVDVTASASGVPMPTNAKLVIGHVGDTACSEISMTSPALTAPTAINRQTLDASFKATIPAGASRTGLTYQIVIDGNVASSTAAANRLYKSETVRVLAPISEQAVLIPVLFNGQQGFAPTPSNLTKLITRSMPHASASFTSSPAVALPTLDPNDATLISGIYYFPSAAMADALVEFDTHCLSLVNTSSGPASATKCVGLLPSNVAFGTPSARALGRAFIGGYSMLMESFSTADDPGITTPYSNHWLTLGAQTFVHEYGHLMSLKHANCGVPGTTDDRLYSDGRLGSGAGYDATRDFYFLGSEANGFGDIMSYCGKGWFSDLGYRVVLNYKAPSTAAREANTSQQGSNKTMRFSKENNRWIARFMSTPSEAVDANKDGSLIHALLAGVPLKTLATDDEPSANGPYFLTATDSLLTRLTSLSGISLVE